MAFIKPWAVGILATAAAAALSACGGSAAPAATSATKTSAPASSAASASSAPKALTNVTLRLDFAPEGYQAPFAYGQETGIYKKYGINLKLVTSNGSVTTVETTAKGDQQFGLADATILTGLAGKGIDAEMIYGYIQQSPIAVIVNQASGITQPSQLAGKTLAVTEAGPTWGLFPAFLAKVGVPLSSIHAISMSGPARIPAMLSNKVQGEVAFGPNEDGPVLQSKGLKIRYFMYSQYGVNAEGTGLITSPALIKSDPQLVKDFVAASAASIQAAKAHPNAAAQAMVKMFPSATVSASVMAVQLKNTLSLLATPADAGKPPGWMAPSDWQQSLQLAEKYLGVKPGLNVSKLYTDQFVGG